ncbi:MAG TPA: sulfite oxidase-like oxidoreductase [Candidatus Polarisedimenticolia bacterium]|nr:sulfite oxidase-like oxidoreductase [Candidatus Polarisedimenticolia bacterium]
MSQSESDRLPPGQALTRKWPVLTYGDAPRIETRDWRFRISGLVSRERTLTWEEFTALPKVERVSDIHCVTRWSRFDNRWEGVLASEVVRLSEPHAAARFVMVHGYGGYSTNLALESLMGNGVLFALAHDGAPLEPEHGGPLRLVVPDLYFWKSAKWANGLEFMDRDRAGFWERNGYHMHGDPWSQERHSGW